MRNKIKAVVGTAMVAGLALTGCGVSASDAEVGSRNISQAADNFEVDRRIVFFNGITDTYLLSIEGKCSIQDQGNQLEVTCKVNENGDLKKHFLGLSDNVSYFVEQLEPIGVSVYHYKVTFKPEVIIPDIDLRTSAGDE